MHIPPQYCRTPLDEPDLLSRLWEASGNRIGILTVAPELPGALNLIAEAAQLGICVGIGHTQASLPQIIDAINAGARISTHLGNGSHQMLPRLDNYVQAQLAQDRLFASFIADGHHMPFTTLKNFLRAKTPGCAILVTDAINAADMEPGHYSFAGMEVEVSPKLRVSKRGEPNLAGSALTLDRAIINVAAHCGFTFEQTWDMASAIPASLVGIDKPRQITVAIDSDGFRLKE